MTRKIVVIGLGASLAVVCSVGTLFAHGFGGGGFHGGFGGGGGFRGGFGGYRGGYGGGFHAGGYGGGYHAGGYGGGYHAGGYGGTYGARGGAAGMYGGGVQYGSRSGSYTTARGGTVNYGAAGVGARGPGGAEAGRGVYGVSGTTAGGRSFADVGRAGGAVGPGGGAVGGRSNVGAVSGPRGTAVAGSRGFAAEGPGGGAVAGRSYGAAAYHPNAFNAYGGYHSGWYHGSWNGNYNGAWGWHGGYWGGWGGWGLGLGTGLGLGWGLGAWGFGSSLYGMGYMPYSNVYYAGDGGGVPYDYSQPIDTVSAPAEQSVADPAVSLFDEGRASFQAGNYTDALQKADQALAKLPNDTTLHEFRGLCLFALGRYDEAAATLYAVLSVGPGWDWTTLISLYPNVEVYTAHLRALEDYCKAHSDSASGRFVLAYHYLTEGFTDSAVLELKQVVALKPNDTLSAKLLRQLEPSKEKPEAEATPSLAVSDTAVPKGATIEGTWSARPAADTAIALAIQPGGKFNWEVTQKGQTRKFEGTSTYGDGILTLAQDKRPALVGRVSWTDASHMTFRVAGDGPEDPGLSFSK